MMTGQLPFDGESMGEVLVKQVTQLPPAPRGLNPSIPPSVEQVLLRCLAKQPDNRFATMIALRDALLDPEAYLRNSPPISPARSVAPGEAKVDAKTVMAHAAAMQKTRIGTAGGMPLPAPAPTVPPGNMAPTVIAEPPPARAPTAGPTAAVQIAPLNNTMRIATPMGYSSRPPRKMWPVVLVFGLVLGLGGGAFAVAWFGRKDEPARRAASGSDTAVASGSATTTKDSGSDHAAVLVAIADAATPETVPVDAAQLTVDPPVPADAQTVASLVIESVPKGAEVYVGRTLLGKTPLEIDWPIAKDPVVFELRAAGYKRRTKSMVISSNTQMRLELERYPIVIQHTTPHPGSGSGSAHRDDGLMRPDD
jgi:serine/threonine-protein kinase